MPLPLATIELGISIANGLIKLGGRVDKALAENLVNRQGISMPQKIDVGADSGVLADALEAVVRGYDGEDGYQERVPEGFSDPDRAKIVAVIGEPDGGRPSRIGAGDLVPLMERYAADKLEFTIDDPDARAMYAIGIIGTGVAKDEREALRIVYYLGPGIDTRSQGLAWQIGMAVVAALAEFGIASQQRFIKDETTRRVISAVLSRLTTEDMLKTASGKELARNVLSATLNGAVDARDVLDQDNPYLEALLDALADAREKAGDAGDDYLLGLVRGKGYKLLVSELLEEGATRLGAEHRAPFQKVIGDVLAEAKTLVDAGQLNRKFFEDNWSDLVRAGLRSVHRNGPGLLRDQEPILREALLAAVKSMADNTEAALFSEDSIVAAVESAVTAVAAKPELLGDGDRGAWLRSFYLPFAEIVGDKGIRDAFAKENLDRMVRGVADQVAKQPELVAGNAMLPQKLIGDILGRVAKAKTLGLDDLAQAAVDGALNVVAENPALLHQSAPGVASPFALIAADLAGSLAEKVRDGKITRGEAEAFAMDGLKSLARRGPALLEKEHPVVQIAVSAALDSLASGDGIRGMSHETVIAAAEAAIVALAERSDELISDSDKKAFAKAFLDPFAEIVDNAGIRGVFTDEGLENMLAGVAGNLARQPELLVGGGVLPQAVVKGVLEKIASTKTLRLEGLAEAGVEAALSAIAESPGLLIEIEEGKPNPFAGVVSSIAESLAIRVRDHGLARPDAADLMRIAVQAVRANPALPEHLQKDLARRVIERVLDAADGNPGVLLRGTALVSVVQAALRTMTHRGAAVAAGEDGAQLGPDTIAGFVFGVVDEGLKKAATDLGRRVDLDSVPLIIGHLIDRWARGEMPVISRTDPKFDALWTQLTEELRQRALAAQPVTLPAAPAGDA